LLTFLATPIDASCAASPTRRLKAWTTRLFATPSVGVLALSEPGAEFPSALGASATVPATALPATLPRKPRRLLTLHPFSMTINFPVPTGDFIQKNMKLPILCVDSNRLKGLTAFLVSLAESNSGYTLLDRGLREYQ
jgi:hypothetical protein